MVGNHQVPLNNPNSRFAGGCYPPPPALRASELLIGVCDSPQAPNINKQGNKMYIKQSMSKAVLTFLKNYGSVVFFTVAVIVLYIWILTGIVDAI